MARFVSSPRLVWLLAVPLFAFTIVEDIHRGAWLHIAAVGVMVFALSQPQLSRRRQRLEYLAFGLFQVSMSAAVWGIATDRRGAAVVVVVFWAASTALVVFGYRKHQRQLRADAARSSTDTTSTER